MDQPARVDMAQEKVLGPQVSLVPDLELGVGRFGESGSRGEGRRVSGGHHIGKFLEDSTFLWPMQEPLGNNDWKCSVDRGMSQTKERPLNILDIAYLEGAFLISPLLIIVLHQSLLTTLLTVSICVFAFGLAWHFS